MKKTIMLLAAAFILASCASIQTKDERNIRRISRLINSGDHEELIIMSEMPFLLDQEIIVLEKDINSFWKDILNAGFKVNEPELERGIFIDEESYKEFYTSMEVKTFFKKYLPEGTRMLELKTSTGRRILLLIKEKLWLRKIYGFKGPY